MSYYYNHVSEIERGTKYTYSQNRSFQGSNASDAMDHLWSHLRIRQENEVIFWRGNPGIETETEILWRAKSPLDWAKLSLVMSRLQEEEVIVFHPFALYRFILSKKPLPEGVFRDVEKVRWFYGEDRL